MLDLSKDNIMETINNIHKVIELYFYGTYEGNEEKLRKAFHEKVIISGFLDGEYKEWTLDNR